MGRDCLKLPPDSYPTMAVIVPFSLTFLLFFSPLLSGFSNHQCVYNSTYLNIQRENGTLSGYGELSGGGLLCGMVTRWVAQSKGGDLGLRP